MVPISRRFGVRSVGQQGDFDLPLSNLALCRSGLLPIEEVTAHQEPHRWCLEPNFGTEGSFRGRSQVFGGGRGKTKVAVLAWLTVNFTALQTTDYRTTPTNQLQRPIMFPKEYVPCPENGRPSRGEGSSGAALQRHLEGFGLVGEIELELDGGYLFGQRLVVALGFLHVVIGVAVFHRRDPRPRGTLAQAHLWLTGPQLGHTIAFNG